MLPIVFSVSDIVQENNDHEVQLVSPKMWQLAKYWNNLAYSAPGGDLWTSFNMSAYFLVFKAVFTF